jgi:hypothetical protein
VPRGPCRRITRDRELRLRATPNPLPNENCRPPSFLKLVRQTREKCSAAEARGPRRSLPSRHFRKSRDRKNSSPCQICPPRLTGRKPPLKAQTQAAKRRHTHQAPSHPCQRPSVSRLKRTPKAYCIWVPPKAQFPTSSPRSETFSGRPRGRPPCVAEKALKRFGGPNTWLLAPASLAWGLAL